MPSGDMSRDCHSDLAPREVPQGFTAAVAQCGLEITHRDHQERLRDTLVSYAITQLTGAFTTAPASHTCMWYKAGSGRQHRCVDESLTTVRNSAGPHRKSSEFNKIGWCATERRGMVGAAGIHQFMQPRCGRGRYVPRTRCS